MKHLLTLAALLVAISAINVSYGSESSNCIFQDDSSRSYSGVRDTDDVDDETDESTAGEA